MLIETIIDIDVFSGARPAWTVWGSTVSCVKAKYTPETQFVECSAKLFKNAELLLEDFDQVTVFSEHNIELNSLHHFCSAEDNCTASSQALAST